MTGELRVEPDQLDVFAARLKQLASDHSRVAPYAREWLNIDNSAGGAFLPDVVDTVHQLLRDLESNLATLGDVTEGSAAELSRSATMYRTTDYATAAALDKTYAGDK